MMENIVLIAPPPIPWIADTDISEEWNAKRTKLLLRPKIRMFMLFADPHNALPTKKNATAMSMTGLRPKTSAKRPQNGSAAVLASP